MNNSNNNIILQISLVTFDFLKAMRVKAGLRLEMLTLVGHSVGAHICGIIAELFRSEMHKYIQFKREREREREQESHEPLAAYANRRKSRAKYYHENDAGRDELDYGVIGAVIGVDPAGPLYKGKRVVGGIFLLKPGYAIYTMIIHTNAGVYGLDLLSGDADFFPDGGVFQPYCGDMFSFLLRKYCKYMN